MAKFKIGDRWSSDFDYEGMLKAGINSKVSDGPVKLTKLFRSFEDVNYHTISKPLWDAIEQIKEGKAASKNLDLFKRRCRKELHRFD